MPTTLLRMRNHFLLDPDVVFLNHGSFGACPREVLQAQHDWQLRMERNPVLFLGRESTQLLTQARAVLAQYLGAASDDLAFMPNATSGVNVVARSLRLGAGDEVLTTNHEYGACDYTWRFVCEHTGAVVKRVEVPLPFRADEFVERVWAGVTARTRVLFLSHLTSTTALIFPLAELCQRARVAGIVTLIDGAHAPGHINLNLDALGADFYTGNCHKWMCAPKGTAFLHARPEHHARLDAPVISWGYGEQVPGNPVLEAYVGRTELQRRLQWPGTRDISGFLAVPAAMAFQQRHHWAAVRQRCHALALQTAQRWCALTDQGPLAQDDDVGQMVLLPMPHTQDADGLKATLYERFRIEVPVTQHQGQVFVRVSVQGYNTQDDLDCLLQALQALRHAP